MNLHDVSKDGFILTLTEGEVRSLYALLPSMRNRAVNSHNRTVIGDRDWIAIEIEWIDRLIKTLAPAAHAIAERKRAELERA